MRDDDDSGGNILSSLATFDFEMTKSKKHILLCNLTTIITEKTPEKHQDMPLKFFFKHKKKLAVC